MNFTQYSFQYKWAYLPEPPIYKRRKLKYKPIRALFLKLKTYRGGHNPRAIRGRLNNV